MNIVLPSIIAATPEALLTQMRALVSSLEIQLKGIPTVAIDEPSPKNALVVSSTKTSFTIALADKSGKIKPYLTDFLASADTTFVGNKEIATVANINTILTAPKMWGFFFTLDTSRFYLASRPFSTTIYKTELT